MSRRLFWAAVVVGWSLMAVGVVGMIAERADARPLAVARLLFGLAVVHDLVFVPLLLGVGLLVARLVPGPVRASVQGGLVAAGIVALFAWPFVRRYGTAPSNPSALPLDYSRGLGILLLVVTAAAVLAAARAWRRSRPDRSAR